MDPDEWSRNPMRGWANGHPWWFLGTLTAAWYLVVLVAARWSPAEPIPIGTAAAVPLAAAAACGWFRDCGLGRPRPARQWWLAVPVLGATALGATAPGGWTVGAGPEAGAVMAGLSIELAGRGVGLRALHRYGPWRGSLTVAGLFAPAAALARPPGGAVWIATAATGFGLAALRWRVNSIWPMVLAQAMSLAPVPWWCPAFLAGYGAVMLLRYPTVAMADRPTVRVLCVDGCDRILLIGWHDPFDGTCAWDLPGGGIEPGETALQAARRELEEESGVPGAHVVDRQVPARRDSFWNGTRYVGVEPFYLARVSAPVVLSRAGFEPREAALIREQRWVEPGDLRRLPGRVQLTALPEIARRLTGRPSPGRIRKRAPA